MTRLALPPLGAKKRAIWAHQSGVNALAVERFDGRLMVSGGSDALLKIWDLDACANPVTPGHTYTPIARIPRGDKGHKFGITHLSFYPFDSAAFLSASFDHTLKLWSTETATISGSFNLESKIYTHAISPIADHLLVACGTQYPTVRLVDLRSGSSVQSLVGHNGAVLATAWSPRHEHVLATGSVDGTIRIWDVRRSGTSIAMFDQEDSLGLYRNGLLGPDGKLRARVSAKAHSGPVNGLTWTGRWKLHHLGCARSSHQGMGCRHRREYSGKLRPSIKNSQLASVTMFTSPVGLTHPMKELLFWPNETEILVLDLHDGGVITRLRNTGPAMTGVRSGSGAERTVKNRITALAWRGAGGGGESSGVVMGGNNMAGAIFSAHLDGHIRAWVPQLEGQDEEAEADEQAKLAEGRSKKRKVLNDVFQSLMGKQITFT
ncbi:DNA excision repair protein ERCC-8 [Apiospora phragmitis]|uniref:DNA excision repair protein ERCC-8 n=1 Tax=Apiospora phragmitis TaxID=2905665 RepID=A0ABR1TVL4_9PEZI